ncbi:hypothetical protein lerEdw1_003116 [Lerista edwardsae]|nr:hypothetical protein lerEdw1_003116 [Lerista edwardsae]
MIHFCLAHAAYHFSRWLPKHHRLRLQFAVFALGLSSLLLQLYVLLRPAYEPRMFDLRHTAVSVNSLLLFRPRSSRYCSQPLLYNLVGSIVFTFFTIGLALLLILMEPVPAELKTILSIFGVGSFVEGVCTIVFTALASQCAKTTPELYYLSVVMSVSSLISAAFFSILGILWLANIVSPGVILNKQAKTGICYEPVSECSCLWHI